MESVNSRKREKELILLATGIIVVMVFVFLHFFSPVSVCIKNNKNINIAILGKSPSLVVYYPVSRAVDIIKVPVKLVSESASNYQKACKIFSFVATKTNLTDTVYLFHVDLGQGNVDFEGYGELLEKWRSSPLLLWKIFKAMSGFDRENMTNFSKYDWYLLFLEMININASNLFITDASKTVPGSIILDADKYENKQHSAIEKIVKVEILNATDMKSAAKIVTRFLRNKGFDVINFGNYSKQEKKTKIIVWHGNLSAAKLIRDAINMNSIEIYSESKKFKITDVTLIIGADFNKEIITEKIP